MSRTTSKPAGRCLLNPRFVWAVAAVAFAVLVGSAAWVKANEKMVEITVDGQLITLKTLKRTVEQALQEAKVSLGPADEVVPACNAVLNREQKIVVTRAVPVVIVADGKKAEVLTTKKTVGEVLKANGVELGSMDRVKPGPEAGVVPGMTVEVVRVKEDITVSTIKIPYSTQKREDPELEIGITKVVQQGEPGIKELKYRTIYENGKKVKTTLVESKVIKQPVTHIIAYGTAGTIYRGNQTIRFSKAFDVIATAYYPGPESTGKWADGYTSIGMKATFGVVAVDPKVIPLRSRLYIDGYGFAIAADVGSAIKGNRIDLCFDSKAEALAWGRRKTKVYLLK